MSGPCHPPGLYKTLNAAEAREQISPLPMAEGTASLAEMVSSISGDASRKLTSINEGVGKSTLLRHIAMREVPIPPHITILFVEQEVKIVHPALVVHSRDPPDCRR